MATTAGETQRLLDAADETRADLRRGKVRRLFVINRAHPSANVSRNAEEAIKDAGDKTRTVVHQRVAFCGGRGSRRKRAHDAARRPGRQ